MFLLAFIDFRDFLNMSKSQIGDLPWFACLTVWFSLINRLFGSWPSFLTGFSPRSRFSKMDNINFQSTAFSLLHDKEQSFLRMYLLCMLSVHFHLRSKWILAQENAALLFLLSDTWACFPPAMSFTYRKVFSVVCHMLFKYPQRNHTSKYIITVNATDTTDNTKLSLPVYEFCMSLRRIFKCRLIFTLGHVWCE